MDLRDQILGWRSGRIVDVDLETRNGSQFSPAVGHPLSEDPATGIWQAGIRASVGHDGVFAAREFLHADLPRRLKLFVHRQARIVSELLGRSDLGIVVADADP